jgi:hypothetical protein
VKGVTALLRGPIRTSSIVVAVAVMLVSLPSMAEGRVRAAAETPYRVPSGIVASIPLIADSSGTASGDDMATGDSSAGDVKGGQESTGHSGGEEPKKEEADHPEGASSVLAADDSSLSRGAMAIALIALLVAIAQLFVIVGLRRKLRSSQGPPPGAEAPAP